VNTRTIGFAAGSTASGAYAAALMPPSCPYRHRRSREAYRGLQGRRLCRHSWCLAMEREWRTIQAGQPGHRKVLAKVAGGHELSDATKLNVTMSRLIGGTARDSGLPVCPQLPASRCWSGLFRLPCTPPRMFTYVARIDPCWHWQRLRAVGHSGQSKSCWCVARPRPVQSNADLATEGGSSRGWVFSSPDIRPAPYRCPAVASGIRRFNRLLEPLLRRARYECLGHTQLDTGRLLHRL